MKRSLIETRHGAMHVRVFGSGGVPLVLLHMSPLSGAMFSELAPLLAATRQVVVPDRIGFGHSDPPRKPLAIADYASSTLDLADALELEQFDVLGMHTGSCEAVELAGLRAGRVRRAGIVGIPAVAAEELQGFKEACIPPDPRADGAQLEWFWRLWTRVVPDGELELAHEWVVEHLASVDAWRTFHAAFDYPIVERIGALSVPLLVIAARDEIWELTQRALPLLPADVEVLELPEIKSDALFTRATETLAGAIIDFF